MIKSVIIYLVRLNGDAKYTGCTMRGIENRWKEHCYCAKRGSTTSALHAGIRKYGADAFTTEVIYQSEDLDHTLNVKEKEFITEHKTHVSHGGYNLTMGGEGIVGRVVSEETRQKMSEAAKGRVVSEETRRKMSLRMMGNKNNVGQVYSAETRRKMSESGKGRVHSEEFCRRISEANMGNQYAKGFVHSEETRLKMSEVAKRRVFSEETRRKMSDSGKRKVFSEEHCQTI